MHYRAPNPDATPKIIFSILIGGLLFFSIFPNLLSSGNLKFKHFSNLIQITNLFPTHFFNWVTSIHYKHKYQKCHFLFLEIRKRHL